MFPCDEVVDVVGCEETLEVQVLRCYDGMKMPYKVKVVGEGEARHDHWLSTLGEDAIRVIVKEFLLNAVGNVTIGMVMGYFKERYAGIRTRFILS